MPVELRKRKAAEPAAAAPAPPAKKKGAEPKITEKVKESANGSAEHAKSNGSSAAKGKPAVGDMIDLESFGGEILTNEDEKVTLKKLVEASKAGVVLFTYPKASTPGCTKQACIFRDEHEPLTATGFSIYGLSTDSPKANSTFKTKMSLPYPLLCDSSATLIGAIGMKKPPKSTTRGVFVVDKAGEVLAVEPGGPDATVEVVRKLIASAAASAPDSEPAVGEAKTEEASEPTVPTFEKELTKEDVEKAETAAAVADTAEKLDSNETKVS